jgi:hypothetical protein
MLSSPAFRSNIPKKKQHSIVINVTSPDVPDLTLIDLPGIVRTATVYVKKKIEFFSFF